MAENGLMMQYFEWDLPNDGQLWNQLKDDVPHLKEMGVTSVWLPPAYKAMSQGDVGYAPYDLYDLGEFDQKGTVRTKYGTKEEYLTAIDALHEEGMYVYADVVINHKAGADETETFTAYEVNPDDRQEKISDPYEIEGWTKFTFPGRKDKYSDFKWHWYHFSGTDVDKKTDKKAIFMIKGLNKGWSDNESVDDEFGNYDYLMFADVDYDNPEVADEVKKWTQWYVSEAKLDGFRLDAIKHINRNFIEEVVKEIRENGHPDFFVVGEYWKNNMDSLQEYLDQTDYTFDLFDVSLHFNFYSASQEGNEYDLRNLSQDAMISQLSTHAVTFVDNHDSQPGQALESYVETWFKPLAYSFILLRLEGFPCLFYGDYYGLNGDEPVEGMQETIDKLLYLRRNHSYGEQEDYFDHGSCIGWTRMGDEEHPYGLAAIMSNGDDGFKEMYVGKQYVGKEFADYTGNRDDKVEIDENGCGIFNVNAGSVSVWVQDGISQEDAFQKNE